VLRGKKVGNEIVNRKRFQERPRETTILSETARSFVIAEKEILETKKRGFFTKDFTIYLMKRYSGMFNNEIAAVFGGRHPSSMIKIAQRTEQKIGSDRESKAIADGLISIFKAC